MKKKVSILSLHLGYGGVEKSVVTLANILCSRYDVEIAVVYKLYDTCVFPLDKRVKVRYLNKDKKPNRDSFFAAVKQRRPFRFVKESFYAIDVLYSRRKTMIQYISKTDADVIISTRDIFNYWLCGYGKDGVLKIGWEHNHFHENYKYANRIVNSAKNLDYFVLVSSELQRFYADALRNSKCMCIFIPNSVDKLPARCASLESKKLISVGRLSPEKGYLDLLKLFKKIYADHPDWTLDIVGDGSERAKLEDFIKQNNLTEAVFLHGFLGKETIDKMLHEAALYVMTSYTESFGIVLIEAMSHGVPCIAYDSAEGAREIITSGYNGFLIKNRNTDAMIKKIEDMMKDLEGRKNLGKMARESVRKYTSDVVGEEWFTLIEESDIYE